MTKILNFIRDVDITEGNKLIIEDYDVRRIKQINSVFKSHFYLILQQFRDSLIRNPQNVK